MTNLRIGMVTTQERDDVAAETLLGLDCPDVTVYKDLEPTLTRNHLAAWRSLFEDPSVTHALLLQDDLLAPMGWRAAVDVFLDRFPTEYAISFYTGRAAAATEQARKWGHIHIRAHEWLNEQALILHRDTWTGYSKWIAGGEFANVLTPAQCRHHDVMLATFLASRGVRVMLSAPSMFQHIGPTSTSEIAASREIALSEPVPGQVEKPGRVPTATQRGKSTVSNPWLVFGRPREAPDWPGVEWDAHAHFDRHLEARPGIDLSNRTRPQSPR